MLLLEREHRVHDTDSLLHEFLLVFHKGCVIRVHQLIAYVKSQEVCVPLIAGTESKTFSLTYTDNRTVTVGGTKAKTATLYAADGTLVARKSVVEGAVSVSLDSCKPGVYVLTLENEHTFKLIKR